MGEKDEHGVNQGILDADFEEIFTKFDVDGNGKIDKEEMTLFIRDMMSGGADVAAKIKPVS